MSKRINRRAFLCRGTAVAGGLALTLGGSLAALADSNENASLGMNSVQQRRAYFALATTRDDQDKACVRHAENKLFVSPEAADRNRAHPGCKCQVVKGGDLSGVMWNQLFGDANNPARESVDRRWAWVGQAMKQS